MWLKLPPNSPTSFSPGLGSSEVKASACNAGELGSIPGLGRSPGEGNGNPLQYSCLKIPWTEELVGYTPQGSKELDTTEWLHFTFTMASSTTDFLVTIHLAKNSCETSKWTSKWFHNKNFPLHQCFSASALLKFWTGWIFVHLEYLCIVEYLAASLALPIR